MKKILYVSNNYNNYKKKIDGQLGAFIHEGLEGYICRYNYRDKQYELCKKNNIGEWEKIYIKKNCFSNYMYSVFVKTVLYSYDFDYIYFRRLGYSVFWYKKLFKRLSYDDIREIYEIPTYPFEKQNSFAKCLAQLFEITILKKHVFPYMSAIPIFCRLKECNTLNNMIKVSNCVEVKNFPQHNDWCVKQNETKIKFLAVAFLQKWHAYDRLIKAISNDDRFEFTIYGNYTSETDKLKSLCVELSTQNVFFVEEKDVTDFVIFYQQYDIAVGCLGIHRKALKDEGILDTSIKNKEYCAMGIPFIHSSEDESFGYDFPYHKIVEDGENIIDIDSILYWYKNLPCNSSKVMRDYAEKFLDYKLYAKKILQFVKWM